MNDPGLIAPTASDAELSSIVAVIDDDPLVRNSIALWLRTSGHVTRSFAAGRDFLDWLTPTTPAIVVTDVRMPGMDGVSLIAAMRTTQCDQPVVVITGHADVPLAVEAMKAGAAEFLEKPFDSAKLIGAVRRCTAALEILTRETAKQAAITKLLQTLSPRETQVLDQLVDGHSNKVIAASLNISPRTVEIHRAHVMAKLRVSSMPELVKLALAAPSLQPVCVRSSHRRPVFD